MYLLIAGNCGTPLNYQNMIRAKSHDADSLDEQAVQFRLFDFCFSVDGDDGMLEKDYKAKLTWETRENANGVEQATALVADYLTQRGEYLSEGNLADVDDYAKRYGVPFSIAIHQKLLAGLLESFKNHYPNWDSSNCF